MTTGLVLSGGGTKGMAHAGALQYFEEIGLKVDLLAGASAGAMVAALYAAGYAPEKILQIFQKESFFSTSTITFSKPGLVDSTKLAKTFEKYFDKDDFSALSVPLYVSATNMLKARADLFHEGPLIMPILASSAFPMVVAPIEMNGDLYNDGGIMNHFPVEVAREKCDKVIGIYLTPVGEIDKKAYNSIRAVVERTFRLGRHASSVYKFEQCDILINPAALGDFGTFELSDKKMQKLFEIGYEAAKAQGDGLKALIS